MVAGTVPSSAVSALPPDTLVQLKTVTLMEFQRWFFIWQMGTVLEIFIIGAMVFLLRPFLPYAISKIFSHKPVVGVMTRTRNIVPMGGFTLRNGMYRKEYGDNVMYFVKKYLGSYFMFGIPADLAHVDRGFVQDPVKNKFVYTLALMGYKSVDAVENALTFNGVGPDDPSSEGVLAALGFTSYETAEKVINPSGLIQTTEIYAPRFSNCPLDALLGYSADIAPGEIAAQVSDTYEWRKPPVEENKLMELLPWIMLIVAMAIAGAIILTQVK